MSEVPEPTFSSPKAPESKNWKVYLFEFLLLLMAVILGFLADNLREEYADREQGRAYVKAFFEDLKKDTVRIAGVIAHEREKIAILEGTVACYDSVMGSPPRTDCLALLIRNSILSTPFTITERTLNQLNMGGFRLLENEDADHITQYISAYDMLKDHENTVYHESQLELRTMQNRLIDFRAFSSIASLQVVNNDPNFRLPPGKKLLIREDRAALNQFFNELHKYRLVTQAHMNQLIRMQTSQVALINYMQDKYEFD
jgi:hypothetical protein